MNRKLYLIVPLAFSGILALVLRAQPLPRGTAAFVDPDSANVTEIRALGERVITQLGGTLLAEVTTAIAQSGPEHAIDVCHLKALPLTGETMNGQPRITAVKRTSQRLRNPANAPDAAEKLALARVEQDLTAGNLPKVLVQQITVPGEPTEWRVYRPVMMAPACVTCHGPREALAPAVRARLATLYPDDRATDYAAGDWRGLIRVSVSDGPPVPAPTPSGR
jgi:mono/diheme cytochrome c family protein